MDSAREDVHFQFVFTADTPTQLTDTYDKWSTSYDKDVEDTGYIGPQLIAEYLTEFYPEERRNVKILDIGAGTGLVGVELQKLGFHTVHGLDPSQSMLEKARATNAYKTLLCQYFTAIPTPGLDTDSFDVIISSGSMVLGHLPPDCFIEAARIVRPGGLLCMLTRSEGTGNINVPEYADKFKAVIKKLKEERKLEEIKLDNVYQSKYLRAIIMIYRILQ